MTYVPMSEFLRNVNRLQNDSVGIFKEKMP